MQQRQSGGLRHSRADASGRASGFALRAAPNYEISCQDYADLAAFARAVSPLTLQTFATRDDLSEHPGREPAGSPPPAEPAGARNLLQLIGQAFGERVLLVQPSATASLTQQTQLSASRIATLARDLRQKLAHPARTTATDGTTRVPAQTQDAAAKITGVNFATGPAETAANSAVDDSPGGLFGIAHDTTGAG